MERVVACALATLVLALPSPAYPCGGSIDLELRTDDETLQHAEELLLSGQYVEAVQALAQYAAPERSRLRRAQLLSLTASIRYMAESGVEAELLDAVVARLRALHAADGQDLLVQARLAEALLLDPEAVVEARELAEDLAARDLVPEPKAWVTLARLRALAGDQAGSWAALRRCARMAGARQELCRGPELSS